MAPHSARNASLWSKRYPLTRDAAAVEAIFGNTRTGFLGSAADPVRLHRTA